MEWEVIKENISAFFNMPIVITLMSITFGFIYVLVIFSKTSLGKKLFNKVNLKYDEVVRYCKEMKENCETFLKEKEEQIRELKETYEQKLAVAVSYTEQIEDLLDKVADTTPNKKIKGLIEEFKSTKEERLAEIKKAVGTYEEFLELKGKAEEVQKQVEDKVNEIKNNVTEELNGKIALYEEKCAQLDNLLKETEERAQKAFLGEGEQNEEGTHTDPEEETL